MKELTILGKSDSIITMILDNIESNNTFPSIKIVNNLSDPIFKDFHNTKFEITLCEKLLKFENLFLGVNNPKVKKDVLEYFGVAYQNFITISHRNVSISTTTKIGTGCLLNSHVSIAAHSILEEFVSVNRNCSIGHHTLISKFVTINPGVNIAGNVKIGEGCLIGMGTNIIDGVTIGKNTIIGAGSLVTKDLPENVVAYGNPCKIIRDNV